MDLLSQAKAARTASRRLAQRTTTEKNAALEAIAAALLYHADEILAANAIDVARAEAAGQTVMIDRLLLTHERIEAMVKELRNVVALDDEAGKMLAERVRPNGLRIQRMSVPLGVVGMIYESRPNVTVDATALCLKSGNAVMLKGGSDAIDSNRALVKVIREALGKTAISEEAVQFIDSTDRAVTAEFLKLRGYLDVVIPRGGKGLIDFVVEHARVPVIETGASVVHTYVDREVDIEMAVKVVVNAKTRRVSICNALDALLVHADVAEEFLRKLNPLLVEKNVEVRCDPRSLCVLKCKKCGHAEGEACDLDSNAPTNLHSATAEDFGKEFLDYILAVKVVDSLNEAIEHITRYSLKHSEAILTSNATTAERFLQEVDAACVYWNASTQFSDGAEFGLGAEMGVSTQKLHARGPFALEGLTTYKWVIRGEGQTRS